MDFQFYLFYVQKLVLEIVLSVSKRPKYTAQNNLWQLNM